MAQIISITDAKHRLLELARRTEELGESFVLIKDSKPISALLPFDEYEAILETLDILETEHDILAKLKKAESDINVGKYKIWKRAEKRKPHEKPRALRGKVSR